jgi:hypothetical protein
VGGAVPLFRASDHGDNVVMARDWRCRLFIHRYEEKRNDQREVYLECARCGHQKFPEDSSVKPPPGAGGPGGQGMMGM